METKWCILFGEFDLGELEETATILGPFDSALEARRMADEKFTDQETFVIPLTEPAKE